MMAISAGTNPDKEIHPRTVRIMGGVGIDLSRKNLGLLPINYCNWQIE